MRDIIFFQALGRSGTQWFAKRFHDVYADIAEVTHEPIQYAYLPKRFFRRYERDVYAELLALPEVEKHIERIEKTSENKTYVEIGFPSYAAIPALQEHFGSRLKLVHLVRNPVMNAASQLTHGWYNPAKRPDLEDSILPTPDEHVHQWYYKDRWARLSQYEKCLFFWSEFHLHALELHDRYPEMAYHRIRFEDVFTGARPEEVMRKLVAFLGLPWRDAMLVNLQEKEDKWPRKVSEMGDWHDIYDHPQALALALQFGYNLDLITGRELKARYLKSVSLPQRIKKSVQHRLHTVLH